MRSEALRKGSACIVPNVFLNWTCNLLCQKVIIFENFTD